MNIQPIGLYGFAVKKSQETKYITSTVPSIVPIVTGVPSVPSVPSVHSMYSSDYLQHIELPESLFIAKGLLPIGLNCIAGRPKKGKSWFALQLCISVANGAAFLGEYETDQGVAVYCALEDNQRRMKRRLHSLFSNEPIELQNFPKDLKIIHQIRSLDCGGFEDLEEISKISNLKLVVIDTIAKIRGAKRGRDNYQEDYAEFGRLQQFALKLGLCMLVVLHTVKGNMYSDPFDCISGTTGVTGAFDGMMVLVQTPTGTVLHGTGRDFEGFELAIKLENNGIWQLLGNAQEVRLTNERRKILETLEKSKVPLTPKEVSEEGELNYKTIRKLLSRMLADGLVERNQNGKYQTARSTGNSGNGGNSRYTGNTENAEDV